MRSSRISPLFALLLALHPVRAQEAFFQTNGAGILLHAGSSASEREVGSGLWLLGEEYGHSWGFSFGGALAEDRVSGGHQARLRVELNMVRGSFLWGYGLYGGVPNASGAFLQAGWTRKRLALLGVVTHHGGRWGEGKREIEAGIQLRIWAGGWGP